MFKFENLTLRYEPFPIGVIRPLMEEGVYAELLDNYPPLELFESYGEMGKPGVKYTLSDKENRRVYDEFIRSSAPWREFHRWVKSDAFIYGVVDMLRERHVDLGYRPLPGWKRLSRRVGGALRGEAPLWAYPLTSRFEFSAIPVDGGRLQPHTDSPAKVATVIVSMVREGEWDPAIGGGTDVNRPKSTQLLFNRVNRVAEFEDMEVLDTYEFEPNQAVVFVKTFNSWHSVRPITGSGSHDLRKTLTIVIERAG